MIVRFLDRLEEGIISLLLVAMTLLVFVEVVLRFGFGEGLLWAEETTLLLAGWFVLFGASHGIKTGAHIGVDFVVRMLPDKVHRVVGAIAVLGALAYCGFFLAGAWGYLQQMWLIGLTMEDLPVPLWLAHSVLLVGFAMLALRLLILLVNIVRGRSHGFQLADEAAESMEKLEHGDRREA
ncbi:MAG: TRAP transporter small permease [Ectothiorhodospiraceae bacterium]|jgi:C4-dicarboxylate transporter DctQ subunit